MSRQYLIDPRRQADHMPLIVGQRIPGRVLGACVELVVERLRAYGGAIEVELTVTWDNGRASNPARVILTETDIWNAQSPMQEFCKTKIASCVFAKASSTVSKLIEPMLRKREADPGRAIGFNPYGQAEWKPVDEDKAMINQPPTSTGAPKRRALLL